MSFPEFRAGARKLLFFSRGKGRGHAMIDLEIVEQLREEVPKLDVRFVSYAEGARTISGAGKPLIDIGLPAENSFIDTNVIAGKLVGWLDPDLVVAHEEFAALPAAKVFDKPAVFLTDWFTSPEKLTMASLRHADRIFFLDEPGIFEEPRYLGGRVDYLGPYFRDFRYSRSDRIRARHELRLPPHATLIGVFPGSWRESATPLADLVKDCLPLLEGDNVYVLWLGGEDSPFLRTEFAMNPRFLVRDFEPQIDKVMVCCNAALTKGNRKSVMELLRLGIPTIAVSWGFNPIDDSWVSQRHEVDWLSATNLDAATLAQRLNMALNTGNSTAIWQPPRRANETLVKELCDRIRNSDVSTAR